MGKLITVIGESGAGKTSLVQSLSKAHTFATAYEGHAEHPFQVLFKQDKKYALPNQIDYLLLRAEQERELRASSQIGLIDGGLDLDFHGFTRLFHSRGLLTDQEFDLCRRFYLHTRGLLPLPDLVVALSASAEIISQRLASRNRINIASAADAASFNSFLEEWLVTLPVDQILRLDVSAEDSGYSRSLPLILARLGSMFNI